MEKSIILAPKLVILIVTIIILFNHKYDLQFPIKHRLPTTRNLPPALFQQVSRQVAPKFLLPHQIVLIGSAVIIS